MHFEGGKKKGEKDVPTFSPWTVKRPPPKQRPPPKEPKKHPRKYISVGEGPPSITSSTYTCEVPHVHKLTQTVSIALSLNIENISMSDRLVQVYTGFPNFSTLKLCFDFLGPCTSHLLYHNNREKKALSCAGAPRSLLPIDEFLLVLCRLRLNLIEEDIAYRFKISQSSVSSPG